MYVSVGLPDSKVDSLSRLRCHSWVVTYQKSETIEFTGLNDKRSQSKKVGDLTVACSISELVDQYNLLVEVSGLNERMKNLPLLQSSFTLLDEEGQALRFMGGGGGGSRYRGRFRIDRQPDSVSMEVRTGLFERKVFLEFVDVPLK